MKSALLKPKAKLASFNATSRTKDQATSLVFFFGTSPVFGSLIDEQTLAAYAFNMKTNRKVQALFVALCSLLTSLPARAEGDHTMHLSVAPIPLLLGAISTNLELKVNERWTVGPSLLYWNSKIFDYHFSASGAGVRAAYSFRNPALQDGPYIAGGLSYASAKVTYRSTAYGELSGEGSGFGLTGLAGYHWVLPSGFTFRVGVGLSLSKLNQIELKDSSGTVREDSFRGISGGIANEIDIGWAF